MIEKLEKLIRAKGLNQDSFERTMGLGQGRISKWKDGQGEPRASQVWAFAQYFGVAADYLLNDNLDEPPGSPISEEQRMLLRVAGTMPLDEALTRLTRPLTGITFLGQQPEPVRAK